MPLFFDGDFPELRQRLEAYLDRLGREATDTAGFRALLLAGGYGRGEGGVFFPSGGAEPRLYNDLEFYLFSEKVGSAPISSWVHLGETTLGIEIEFKTLAPAAMEQAEPSMFYYDLLSRNVFVAGKESWLESLPARLRSASEIPAVEASRLLVNRGMSLLCCRRWASGELDLPSDFCARIIAKLKLALADAVLCLQGRYHWSCRERNRRLAMPSEADTPPDWKQLVEWHLEGVAFKLRPEIPDLPASAWQEPLENIINVWLHTFLWIEGRRLESEFRSASGYINFSGKIFPHEPPLKNLLRQLRDRRRFPHLPWSGLDHPRAQIWKALVALLCGDASAIGSAAGLLGRSGGKSAVQLEERLRDFWKSYP